MNQTYFNTILLLFTTFWTNPIFGNEYGESVNDININNPNVEISSNVPICEGGDLHLMETGGTAVDWQWSGPNGFLSLSQNIVLTNVTVDNSGIYSVIITDANGCTNTASTTVTVNSSPTAANLIGTATICNGESTNLSVTITGGTGPFTVVHNDGLNDITLNNYNSGTNILVSPSSTTNYTLVSVTDANDCVVSGLSGNPTVTVNDGSSAANLTGNVAICDGESTGLSVTITGGTGPFTVVHNDGLNDITLNNYNSGTNILVSPSSTTSYTLVSVIDANSCVGNGMSGIVEVEVFALPTVTMDDPYDVCEDAELVNLIATPMGGMFSGVGVSGNTFDSSLAGVGVHTITYTYTDANGCTNTTSQDIEVYALPTITMDDSQDVCEDAGLVNLIATPVGGTFSGVGVSGNQFDPSLAGIGVHSITYEYTNADGCANTTTQDIKVLSLIPTFSNPTDLCLDSGITTINSGASPPGGVFSGTGVIDNGDGVSYDFDSSIGAGIYPIIYVVTNCQDSVVTTIQDIEVYSLPQISFSGLDTSYFENDPIVDLIGNPAGGTFSGIGVTGNQFDPSIAGIGVHTITYEYTDANGCTNSYSQEVTINEFTSTNQVDFDNKIKIYPNPFDHSINIISEEKAVDQVRVFTQTGQEIFVEFEKEELKISDVPSGLYFMEIQIGKAIIQKKIIRK